MVNGVQSCELDLTVPMRESWRYAYRGIIPQDFLDAIPEGRWNNSFDTPGWNTLVCTQDDEYIGTSSFCKSRFEKYKDSGEVISLYLMPEYTGKGYEKKLLDTVIDELRKQGFKEVFLWVLEENRRARVFYEKYGFKLDDDYIEDIIGEKKLREIRYVFRIV